MQFNSIQFAIFLPIFFFIYWVVCKQNTKIQNLLLLVASYMFYGWWDWRLLFLLGFISTKSYFSARLISSLSNELNKRLVLLIAIITDIGVLIYFKYFNFFIGSLNDFFCKLGYKIPLNTLKIILPIGISFYIFLSISYLIDTKKEKIVAERGGK